MANETASSNEEHGIRQQIKECIDPIRKFKGSERIRFGGAFVFAVVVTLSFLPEGMGLLRALSLVLLVLFFLAGTFRYFSQRMTWRLADQSAARFDSLFPPTNVRRTEAIAVLREMASNEQNNYRVSAKVLLAELGVKVLPTSTVEEQWADALKPAPSQETVTSSRSSDRKPAGVPAQRIGPEPDSAEGLGRGRRHIPLEPESSDNP